MKLQIILFLSLLIFSTMLVPAFAEFTVDDVKLIDPNAGTVVDIINVDQIIQISANITNNSNDEQAFTYTIFTNSDNSRRLAWITGSLSANQTYSPALSILPEQSGTYQNIIMVIDSLNPQYRNLLAPTHNLSFTTGINSTITFENDFTFNPTLEESPYDTLTINADPEYYKEKSIIITGNVVEIPEIGIPSVTLAMINHNNNLVYMNAVPIKSDWTYEFSIDTYTFDIDDYTVEINSGNYSDFVTFSLIPSITIQLDKEEYYLNNNIFINGTINGIDLSDTTITYDVIYENNTIQTGDGGILQDDGTFSFIINTDTLNYTGHFEIIVTIQGYQGISNFYYYDTIDIANEALYDYILINNSILSTHDETLANQDYTLNYHNQTITAQNNTITLQQLEIDDFQNQLTLLSGYLLNLNVTLGEFPPILNSDATNSINNEIQRLQDDISIKDLSITADFVLLQNATDNNEQVRIDILTNTIGSSMLTREISQSNLNMIHLYLDIYPQ